MQFWWLLGPSWYLWSQLIGTVKNWAWDTLSAHAPNYVPLAVKRGVRSWCDLPVFQGGAQYCYISSQSTRRSSKEYWGSFFCEGWSWRWDAAAIIHSERSRKRGKYPNYHDSCTCADSVYQAQFFTVPIKNNSWDLGTRLDGARPDAERAEKSSCFMNAAGLQCLLSASYFPFTKHTVLNCKQVSQWNWSS